MLERYKPENFLTCYIPGKPEPVKDKPDIFRDEDKAKISGALSAFRKRESMVAGLLIELQDEDRVTLDTVR